MALMFTDIPTENINVVNLYFTLSKSNNHTLMWTQLSHSTFNFVKRD